MTQWKMRSEPLVVLGVVVIIDHQLAFNRNVRAALTWKRHEANILMPWLAAAQVAAT